MIDVMLRIFILAVFLAVPGLARADIYKYVKEDGTVVYTDSLSDLPRERREHYNRMREKEAEKEEELKAKIGAEEYARKKAEEEKERLLQEKADQQERQRRIAQINSQLNAYRAAEQKREREKLMWKTKMQTSKDKLQKLLKEFNEASEKANSLGMRASHTLLPGQAQEQQNARKKMKQLEPQIDKQIHEVQVQIPEDARKAGVPPGWLR